MLSEKLGEMKVFELLSLTASKDPIPGGGSMAALAAAVSASLTEMVANLTIGKKGYEGVESEMNAVVGKMGPLRKKLLEDMDRDSEAYRDVFAAYQQPKNSTEEKEIRRKSIQHSLKHAAEVPMSVAEDALEILESTHAVLARGNKNAVSDSAVAAMMARTAALSALHNVRINLGSIKDRTFIDEMSAKSRQLEERVLNMEKKALSQVKF